MATLELDLFNTVSYFWNFFLNPEARKITQISFSSNSLIYSTEMFYKIKTVQKLGSEFRFVALKKIIQQVLDNSKVFRSCHNSVVPDFKKN